MNFKIHNIKLSLKIVSKIFYLNRDRLRYINETNKNFSVLKDSDFTFVIFKAKQNTEERHCNITKIPCFCAISDSVTRLFFIFEKLQITQSPKIDNITCTLNIEKKVNLKKLYMYNKNFFEYIYYVPERFPAVFIRMTKLKGTCLFFSSGKVILVGFSDPVKIVSAVNVCNKVFEKTKV